MRCMAATPTSSWSRRQSPWKTEAAAQATPTQEERGGHAILAMIEHDLVPFFIGKDAGDIEGLHEEVQWHVHYVGRGGVASFAISALDIALWDPALQEGGQAAVADGRQQIAKLQGLCGRN